MGAQKTSMLSSSLQRRTSLALGFLALGSLVCAERVHAYSLDDHEQITRAAIRNMERCLESDLDGDSTLRVVKSNLWEDKNIFNKWIRFSHFYHPEHPELGALRDNSRARVVQLQDLIEDLVQVPGQTSKRLKYLGYLIHHIQDMSVPLHVLPVNHFWTDGFEKYELTLGPSSQDESCKDLIQEALQTSPVELHQSVAWETLELSRNGELTASYPWNHKVPLSWFWEEGSNDEFGGYGILGNSFGMSWLSTRSQKFRIEQQEFARFKTSRLAAAERATRLILIRYWLLGALDAAR
jgi:hypothetical protein